MIVINGKIDGFVGEDKIYIGRYNEKSGLKSSPLSNPYFISANWSREKAIVLYKSLLWESIKTYRDKRIADARMMELIRISRLENVKLVCYCKPLACHGDIVIDAINWLKIQPWFYH